MLLDKSLLIAKSHDTYFLCVSHFQNCCCNTEDGERGRRTGQFNTVPLLLPLGLVSHF